MSLSVGGHRRRRPRGPRRPGRRASLIPRPLLRGAAVPPQLLGLPSRDVVPHARSLPAAVEAGGGLEQGAVVGGGALVLAGVVAPGLAARKPQPAVPGTG